MRLVVHRGLLVAAATTVAAAVGSTGSSKAAGYVFDSPGFGLGFSAASAPEAAPTRWAAVGTNRGVDAIVGEQAPQEGEPGAVWKNPARQVLTGADAPDPRLALAAAAAAATPRGEREQRQSGVWLQPPEEDSTRRGAEAQGFPLERNQRSRRHHHHRRSAMVQAGAKVEEGAAMRQPFPTYIPRIGVANVTTPTALPPPPPVLNPVEDYQPVDTAIGDYMMKQFVEPPTVTPPPLQSALDALSACPLIFMPARFVVRADTGCAEERSNEWLSGNGAKLVDWNESCSSAGADVTYTLGGGGRKGVSRSHINPGVDAWDLFHCDGLSHLYTFEEKVFKRADPAHVDPQVCERYGICDGTVYVQYFVKNPFGTLLGLTALLPLYTGEFTLNDPTGGLIAKFARNGAWSPKDMCPEYTKEWQVEIGTSGSPLTAAINRWVIGTFMSVVSLRDTDRDGQGIVKPSACQIATWSGGFLFVLIFIIVVLFVLAIIYRYFIGRITKFCFMVELAVFPKTMMKPSVFDP